MKQLRPRIDKRELYILIESDEWADTVQLNPDLGKRAREFAQALNLAARRVEQTKAARAQAVEAATRRLHEVQADRSAVEAAQTQRAALELPQAVVGLKPGPTDPVVNPAG